MRLLPKSIHRCHRYPTKFNSGRDFPQYIHLVLHQILEPDHLCHDEIYDRQKQIVAVFAPKIHVHVGFQPD